MSASLKQQFPRQHPIRRPGARAGSGSSASGLAPCAYGPDSTLWLVAQKTLVAECRQAFAPYRWRRFIMRLLGTRQWYEQSLLLWVVARSCLRYLPYPYPSVSTVQSWIPQAEAMVVQAVLPRAHHELALEAKVHTAKNSILELQRF